MKITNEFTVHTPIDRAWQVLTDLEGIAPCLPGAQLTGVDGDVYKGKVKVKVGPVISDFAGTAQFTEKDDSAYRAVIDAKGRDARAGGNASALVTAALKPDGDSTLVSVDTDLKISGKLAQFGSGMIKEISNKLLTQFVANLEAKLATDDAAPAPALAPAAETAPTAPTASAAPAPASAGPAPAPGSAAPAPASAAPAPGSAAPGSAAPGSAAPGSAAPGSAAPGSAAPGSAAPGSASPGSAAPASAASESAAPAVVAATPSSEAPSPEKLTANLIPAEPGAAEPATPAVGGSEPLAASTTDNTADAVATPPATTTPPAPTTTPAAAANAASTSTAAANDSSPSSAFPVNNSAAPSSVPAKPLATEEPEPLDLLAVAGSSIYKRAIPVAIGAVVVVGVIVWFVARG
ncbi:SRPBCC family protein [Paractinoplanes ovalisporus]|uniref:SRPBCC family protein n=1 Tax=Paractinoplanes ovalisporus TaxID=2810368 RepID=UPI001F28F2DD|nr:SRPBCC family protein [Actinoplanes ovalisporus]